MDDFNKTVTDEMMSESGDTEVANSNIVSDKLAEDGKADRKLVWWAIGGGAVVALVIIVAAAFILMLVNRKEQLNDSSDGTLDVSEVNDDSEKTIYNFDGQTITVAEGMRRNCNEPIMKKQDAPIIAEGWLPRHWDGTRYVSVVSDGEYLWVCDWGIGLKLEDGLDVAYQADGPNSISFVGITKDTEFFQQNRYDNVSEAPSFYSDLFDEDTDYFGMIGVSRVSEQDYQVKLDECGEDGGCLAVLDAYWRPFLKHNGYVYIMNRAQALRTTCPVANKVTGIVLANSAVPCPEMQWEEESFARLRKWAYDDRWITF